MVSEVSPIVKISEFQEVFAAYSILVERSIIPWYEGLQAINEFPAENRLSVWVVVKLGKQGCPLPTNSLPKSNPTPDPSYQGMIAMAG